MTYQTNIKAARGQGSPVFIWTNASPIVNLASTAMDWESYRNSSVYYLPFNYTRITNNSSSQITFYPNQDSNQGIPIPSGANVSIDADIVPAVHSFKITNNDSTQTIAANQITILCSKTPIMGGQ